MVNFKIENDAAHLIVNNKTVKSFVIGDYLCTLKKAVNDYSMSHGSFNIKEHTYIKNDYTLDKIEADKNKLTLICSDAKFIISIENDNRIKVTPYISEDYNKLIIELPSFFEEGFYGSGETFDKFNLKGYKINVWVAEHINGLQTAKKILKNAVGLKNVSSNRKNKKYETYYAEPTFISSQKYYYHNETTSLAKFDFSDENKAIIQSDSTSSFYFGFANSFDELLYDMTDLLGRQPELPDWVYDGAILGVQGGTEVMMNKVEAALNAGTKVAGVWIQDWEGRRVTAVGKQLQWNWQWDSELYPDLDIKIKELNAKGIKVLGYINPFLAVEKDLYKEATEKGYCVKDSNDNDYYVTITTFPAAMIDLTNPDAYEWIKNIIKTNMIDFGFSGWMADFGEYLPTDCVLHSGESAEKIHNTWPALWAKVNREAVEEAGKLGEIMFFTRAGYTKTKKYSTMMWNGDNHVDYTTDFGLPSVIPAMMSLTCCGFGLSHSDIGGYTTFMNLKRSDELFMRWCEMNAFSPLYRGHEGLNPDLNAQFDYNNITLKHHARFSRIHEALKPYLKDMVKINNESGLGVVRPLFFYYDEEEALNEKYEYLLGRDILVAPVIKKNTDYREVYLPKDKWIHLWSGTQYIGGSFSIKCPLGKPPIFIRKDSEYFDSLMAIANL